MSLSAVELVDGERFVLVLFFADHVQREAFGDFFQHALRLLGFLQQIGDLRKRGDLDRSFFCSRTASSSIRLRLRGSARAMSRVPVLPNGWHEVVAEHQVHGDRMEQVVIDAHFAQIDELAAVARGQGLRLGDFLGRVQNFDAIDRGHESFEPHRNVSAREKIGRYSATSTKVTKRP